MPEGAPRAGRLATLGAWLHVWPPRRGVDVPPPPPRRRLVLWTVAIGVPVAVALAVGLTLLAHARDDQAASERREAAAVEAPQLARLRAEQPPPHGRGRPVPPHGSRTQLLARRHALVGKLEHAITTDVHARYRAGTIEDDVARTTCPPYTT